MDTTETYIKKCEKAVEIQAGHLWEYGDCFIQVYANGEYSELQFMSRELDDPYYGDYPNYENGKRAIFLPRQDDLQKMVKPRHITRLVEDLDRFTIDCESCWRGNIQISMEQLWFAFVMKEECNKVWSGEDWVADS